MDEKAVTLTLPGEVMENIGKVVDLSGDRALETLVADALRSYLHLGQLSARGAEFYMRPRPESGLRRMSFPFEQRQAIGASGPRKDQEETIEMPDPQAVPS
ncbi:MAG: hypothetical protein JKP97_00485 [Rhodobacteraceae bacterium]|jgi:hypothetical protein|nr:hypothetical protein [Paracoccaceae bacterium]